MADGTEETLTQLTAYQNLSAQQQQNDDETKNPKKENITEIFLGDGMKEIKPADRYTTSSRLFMMYPVTWSLFATFFVCSTADTEDTADCELNSPKKIALILYNGVITLSFAVVIVYGMLSKYPLAVYANNLCGLQSFNDSKENDPYDFSIRPYAGIFFLCCVLYTAFISMIDDIFIDLLELPVTTRCIATAANVAILVFWKRVKCQTHIMNQKQSVLKKYDMLQGIEHNINENIKELRSSQLLANRKVEFALIFILLFINNYFGTAVLDWFLWEKGAGAIVTTTIIFVTDALMLSYILFSLHTICLHYNAPSIIMDELGSSVHCKNINELIAWWELRKFYRDCIVQVYFSSLQTIIASVLNISIVIIVFLFARIVLEEKTMDLDNLQLGVWICYIVAITFVFIRSAANYNSRQLAHEHMIRREAMALQTYVMYSPSKTSREESEWMHYIVEQMKEDIRLDPHAMRVFGTKIDATLMIFLRASIGTIAITLISILM